MTTQRKHVLDLAFVTGTMPDGCTDLLVLCVCPSCHVRRGELPRPPHPASPPLVLERSEQDGPWHD